MVYYQPSPSPRGRVLPRILVSFGLMVLVFGAGLSVSDTPPFPDKAPLLRLVVFGSTRGQIFPCPT